MGSNTVEEAPGAEILGLVRVPVGAFAASLAPLAWPPLAVTTSFRDLLPFLSLTKSAEASLASLDSLTSL